MKAKYTKPTSEFDSQDKELINIISHLLTENDSVT